MSWRVTLMILKIRNLNSGYGNVRVLWDVNLEINYRQKIALVGSNGGGKSTLLKTIAGLLKPLSGEIVFDNQDITNMQSQDIVSRGISLIPEGYKLFSGMTVKENLYLGAYNIKNNKFINKQIELVYEIFPELKHMKNKIAGTMSGGQQQMCSIGRGLMSNPKLLLIDELSLGLAPVLVESLVTKINEVHQKTNMSLLLVDQDLHTAFSVAESGFVIETGRITLSGSQKDLLNNPKIIESYLGL
jgi:branched-chain amino acid transport system ATP-binding protein